MHWWLRLLLEIVIVWNFSGVLPATSSYDGATEDGCVLDTALRNLCTDILQTGNQNEW